MKYLFCVWLIIAVLVAEGLSLELPSSFNICRRSNPKLSECVNEAATKAIISMAQGLKDFKILPIEPLSIDSVTIGGNGGPVSLKQEYKNLKIHGLTTGFRAYGYKFDWDHNIISGSAYNERIDYIGDYKLDGKILLLPVVGTGRANISLSGLTTHSSLNYTMYEKNGETYVHGEKYAMKFAPKKVYLHFDNLFNGDKVLGDQMNKFINENSEILFKEFQEPFEEIFGTVFLNIFNSISSRIPFKKMFPE